MTGNYKVIGTKNSSRIPLTKQIKANLKSKETKEPNWRNLIIKEFHREQNLDSAEKINQQYDEY